MLLSSYHIFLAIENIDASLGGICAELCAAEGEPPISHVALFGSQVIDDNDASWVVFTCVFSNPVIAEGEGDVLHWHGLRVEVEHASIIGCVGRRGEGEVTALMSGERLGDGLAIARSCPHHRESAEQCG